ncbi:hypothetical protein BP6252_02059 [Coleophoma cylindrospora]|uniref:CRIB domain-containing protein n=1 Tax=Coleophoma cylindrospora TaxID=1849047 RepID=A0A3D8SDS9_9HELO|nr:hypothetical protein BP6252_02059 [Coleophoma cylindrospora]
MFGFSKSPGIPTSHFQNSKLTRDSVPVSQLSEPYITSTESFEAAIDGPPSPERIRAYTEQMRRSSIFGNNSRTQTLSSGSSSFRSGESTGNSTDNLSSLSRKSSVRSNASSMYSAEKPEGSQSLGKAIFSRTARKLRRESAGTNEIGKMKEEEASARERYYGKASTSRPGTAGSMYTKGRPRISSPTNFQHVTHTRQEHLPNLARSSRNELASEFTAIRASQVPTRGELKGILAEDLHFQNFSSEMVNDDSSRAHRASPERPYNTYRESAILPPQPFRTKSHDMLRQAPPRPPRSPLYPQDLPTRTSSRIASTVIDEFNLFPPQSVERPQTSGGYPRLDNTVLETPQSPIWSEQDSYFDRPVSHAVTTPGDEAWPLKSSNLESPVQILENVPEEDESVAAKRRSGNNGELRFSQSVPALRLLNREVIEERPDTGMSTTSGKAFGRVIPDAEPSPKSPTFRTNHASWEDDIDYCYEHEAEADCDYQWDRHSLEATRPSQVVSPEISPKSRSTIQIQDSERAYHGRFRPSLLVPSKYEVPELSPLSQISLSESDPRTPSGLRPAHLRSPSQASSFKESHGFSLSPSLLIPADFGAAMDQDHLYDELDRAHAQDYSSSATIFSRDSYGNNPASPIDESISSTASYRSSAFSRESARSSSCTRISARSHTSQESLLLLNAGTVSQAHRSIGSASSIPDLIPSGPRNRASNISLTMGGVPSTANLAESEETAPGVVILGTPIAQPRRKNSLLAEQVLRKAALDTLLPPTNEGESLSPVAESFPSFPRASGATDKIHGRKVSAPIMSPTVKEFKGRARASTATMSVNGKPKTRGSNYMLFPPTS